MKVIFYVPMMIFDSELDSLIRSKYIYDADSDALRYFKKDYIENFVSGIFRLHIPSVLTSNIHRVVQIQQCFLLTFNEDYEVVSISDRSLKSAIIIIETALNLSDDSTEILLSSNLSGEKLFLYSYWIVKKGLEPVLRNSLERFGDILSRQAFRAVIINGFSATEERKLAILLTSNEVTFNLAKNAPLPAFDELFKETVLLGHKIYVRDMSIALIDAPENVQSIVNAILIFSTYTYLRLYNISKQLDAIYREMRDPNKLSGEDYMKIIQERQKFYNSIEKILTEEVFSSEIPEKFFNVVGETIGVIRYANKLQQKLDELDKLIKSTIDLRIHSRQLELIDRQEKISQRTYRVERAVGLINYIIALAFVIGLSNALNQYLNLSLTDFLLMTMGLWMSLGILILMVVKWRVFKSTSLARIEKVFTSNYYIDVNKIENLNKPGIRSFIKSTLRIFKKKNFENDATLIIYSEGIEIIIATIAYKNAYTMLRYVKRNDHGILLSATIESNDVDREKLQNIFNEVLSALKIDAT